MDLLTPRTILAPIDFSELSRHALTMADRIAHERNANLTVLHVHPVVQTAFMDLTYPESPERMAQAMVELEARMAEWTSELKTPQDKIDAKVIIGNPVDLITQESSKHGLLVISTHGRTGISHFLMGSVAERVVRVAHCAVLVVKKDNHPQP
ncbi:MAG: universal stress protein [Deltaproteobacteria bacterium]|jgi:universal stress protein A|nr:universal stress protein [Deltaproteobacteria bacterium]MBT6490175.1 universal stress protein [Deltaproteobacteria bacterium]